MGDSINLMLAAAEYNFTVCAKAGLLSLE